jgi:hypothetical protein
VGALVVRVGAPRCGYSAPSSAPARSEQRNKPKQAVKTNPGV